MIQHLKKVPYFGSKLIRGDLFNLASPKLRKSQIYYVAEFFLKGGTLPFAEMFFAEKKFRNEGSLTSLFAEIIFAENQVAELGAYCPAPLRKYCAT